MKLTWVGLRTSQRLAAAQCFILYLFFCLISALSLTFLNLVDTLSRLSLVHCKSQWSMKLSSHCNTFKMFAQLHSPHFNPNINWKRQLQLFSVFSVSVFLPNGRIWQNLIKAVHSGISVFVQACYRREIIWTDLFCVVLFFGINWVE